MTIAHRAEPDVTATIKVFQHKPFFKRRKEFVFKVMDDATVFTYNEENAKQFSPNNDSDTDRSMSASSKSSSTTSSTVSNDMDALDSSNLESNFDQVNVDQPTTTTTEEVFPNWKHKTIFWGENAEEKFDEERFLRAIRSNEPETPVGLRRAVNSVNSPLKAWNQIFTRSILDMIVRYTNEYGEAKGDDDLDPLTRKELIEFLCVLYIASLQKRKDRPWQWFSNDPLLECKVMKTLMSGNRFHSILRTLHVCSLGKQPQRNNSPEYDPVYKVKELMDAFEARFSQMYNRGQKLSLDESVIRAFGRIKFEVRIICKSARYGIKMYVITDATTAFVLRVIVYTGSATYSFNPDKDVKKTVKIVQKLCEPFEGTYRSIYIDRFYTSIELIKTLETMKLYVTGTVMANRLPKQVQLTASEVSFMEK